LLNAGGKSPREVRAMFARVARRYDLLNHLLSFGRVRAWRRAAAREAAGLGAGDVLADLCTGTGDLALALSRVAPEASVIALDFTPEMLRYGAEKAARRRCARVSFALGDALALPLSDNCAALASVAFGIRNVADLSGALREMARVVRPGGKVLILEFTRPASRVFGPLYMCYFRHALPIIGRIMAAAAGDAYRYLPQSVQAFAGSEEMTARMRAAGLAEVRAIPHTCGIVHMYVGIKMKP
jgi:demethylmenaquinone methyltransferase / 2-methoxy-6-polyprenyl-1,4-benzoquinol methylase